MTFTIDIYTDFKKSENAMNISWMKFLVWQQME